MKPTRFSGRKRAPMESRICTAMAFIVACSVSMAAQWPRYEDSGVPRDAQGRVLATAPPARMPDGKPDLSGLWTRADRDPLPAEIAGIVGNRAGQTGQGGRGAFPPGIPV